MLYKDLSSLQQHHHQQQHQQQPGFHHHHVVTSQPEAEVRYTQFPPSYLLQPDMSRGDASMVPDPGPEEEKSDEDYELPLRESKQREEMLLQPAPVLPLPHLQQQVPVAVHPTKGPQSRAGSTEQVRPKKKSHSREGSTDPRE